ncbi:MFS transporter [Tenuibacillus multivorans]|uniref:Na+/melibiose symporter n=1 Tax=Tenuibacillus multivorans TaxID=237069 RepID=A0A1H0BR12_9BACI|nr:MFS transporter [Tenuibacillus multivorans]GEL77068.1 MFS transporter [Tenuibacillus multivorans]SDN48046.1 Na+/melibiose symporter [Tenuibacillus multivorans]
MRNYKFILIAFFLSEYGRAMYFVTVTWLLYEFTGDAKYTGLLVGLGFLPGLVFNLFFGVIVDRMNRKILSVTATSISAISISVLFILMIFGIIEPWVIIGVHMILQLSGSLFRPSIQAFIAEIFKKEQLPNIFSKSSSFAILGGLLGASTGGIIISLLSSIGSMTIVTISFIAATLSLILIKKPIEKNVGSDKESKKTSVLYDLREGFQYVKNNRFLLGLFIIMFNGQLVFHTSLGFLSVYTVDYLNSSSTVYGFLDATLSVGGAIAGLLGAWWWKKNEKNIASFSISVMLIGLMIVGVFKFIPFVAVGLLLIGLGSTWVRTLLQAVQQIATESNYHGRMASFRMIFNQGSVVISGPILGWVASDMGANFVYIGLMIPLGLCLIFSFFQSRSHKFVEITKKSA